MSPFVTVVVPVRNGAHEIRRCLDALLDQGYPADRYEIVIVDNDSDDGTADVVREYPVRLLHEDRVHSPYAARNLAIEQTRGEILAFTDADCAPASDWLESGVATLEREGADLLGGEIRFRLSPRPTSAEIFDAISNADNERSVQARGVAKTGNLFATRRAFDALGPFRSDRRSGGDVDWTSRATRAGYRIVYQAGAAVEMPALGLGALLRKQYRVGRGQYDLWLDSGLTRRRILQRTLRGLVPHRPAGLLAPLRRRAPAGAERRLGRVWLVGWLCTTVTGLGRLYELLRRAGRGI